MSLTSFLAIKEVSEKFKQEFPQPKFDLNKEILAAPLTSHFILVGTAFDYLMRFYLKYSNPDAITKMWVAEHVPEHFLRIKGALFINANKNKVDFEESLSLLSKNDQDLFKKIKEIIEEAKENYFVFIKTGQINDQIIKSSLLLAQLDPIYRASYINENIGLVDAHDIEDLRKLISLVNLEIFKASKICLLNPIFGEASRMVGGADADLVIDDTLIDIKTTKFLRLDRKMFNQLIGYYILSRIGGIGESPLKCEIKKLGIFYPRFNELYIFRVSDIIDESRCVYFQDWFEKAANGVFGKTKRILD